MANGMYYRINNDVIAACFDCYNNDSLQKYINLNYGLDVDDEEFYIDPWESFGDDIQCCEVCEKHLTHHTLNPDI